MLVSQCEAGTYQVCFHQKSVELEASNTVTVVNGYRLAAEYLRIHFFMTIGGP
jgi:hypothetical protein